MVRADLDDVALPQRHLAPDALPVQARAVQAAAVH